MAVGGLASFGHAAYLRPRLPTARRSRCKTLGLPMAAGAASLAPCSRRSAPRSFGWFAVRLSGVYLAMLTLAFAQIVWSIAFQWVSVTGGDNGLLGVWPSPWAASAGLLLL